MKKMFLLIGSVALLAIGAWLWLERATRPDAMEPPHISGVIDGQSNPSAPSAFASGSSLGQTSSDATTMTPVGTADSTGSEPPLDTTADSILAEPDENLPRVAKKLAALVKDPRVPLENREEALAHALNLAAGNETEILDPLVTDPNVPDSLAETILAEALNRSLSEQADLYLAALSARQSPEMQALIREHLAFLTDGEDLGPRPAAWLPVITAAKKEWAE